MAVERVTERTDGNTVERTIERGEPTTTVVNAGGDRGGMSRTLITLAVLAVIAIAAFLLLRPLLQAEEAESNAVAGAASEVGEAAGNIGEAVGNAADRVAPSD